MSRTALVGIALLPVLAALVACGGRVEAAPGPPAGDPGSFVTSVVRLVAEGRYGAAWDRLHPRHQAAVSRAEYVRCEGLEAFPGMTAKVTVLRVFDRALRVGGLSGPVASKAVKGRLSVTAPGLEAVVYVHTFHAVPVDGRWAWVLPPERLRAYQAGLCPNERMPSS